MVLSVPLVRDSLKVTSSASQVVAKRLITKVAVVLLPHIYARTRQLTLSTAILIFGTVI